MKEQTLKDLGFEIQHETVESSGADKDWYYYTMNIGDICLITNDCDEALDNGWEVSIGVVGFDFDSCIIKASEDLEDLIRIMKNNSK